MEERKTGYSEDDIDELKAFFKKNDITRFAALDKEYTISGKKSDIYAKAKKYFFEKWEANIPAQGVKRNMKNSSAVYPVNLLKDADAGYFAEQVADIFSDEEKYRNAIDMFFEMYEEPLSAGFEAYAAKENKSVEELTDDEIWYVVDQIADTIDGELTNVTMIGQKVPEIFGVSKNTKAHEDYSKKAKNPDRTNFEKSWYHSDTKIGTMLYLEELQKKDDRNGTDVIANAHSVFDEGGQSGVDADAEYEKLRNAFADTLDSTDLAIFEMREKGMTDKEIAAALKYKTHSAVVKRLAKMKEKYMEFRKTYTFSPPLR